jgi:hypothetical protein
VKIEVKLTLRSINNVILKFLTRLYETGTAEREINAFIATPVAVL